MIPAPAGSPDLTPYADVRCPVNVVLGTGSVTVRQCLALKRQSVLRLVQSAGEDLVFEVSGVPLARGEVVIVEDSTAIRLTEISQAPMPEVRS